MSKPKELKLIEHIDRERNVLYFSGLYPVKVTALFYLSRAVHLLGATAMFVTMAIKMALVIPDLVKMTESIQFLTTQFSYLLKSLQFCYNNKVIMDIEKDLRTDVLNLHTEDQYKMIEEPLRNSKNFRATWSLSVFIACSFYCSFPVIANNPLLVPAWFPFNITTYRTSLLAFQGCSIMMNGYSHAAQDCIMTAFAGIVSVQIKILLDNLRKATYVEDGVCKDDEERDELVSQRLYKCVKHYTAIITFASKVERMFVVAVTIQFFSAVITICLVGFTMLWLKDKMLIINIIIYITCLGLQTLMPCWYGHGILSESESITNACYMNVWYNCGPKVRKALFIIMERSKQPIQLTVGKIAPLNLSTMLSVLKSAYSYFAVLRRVYNDGT